MLNWSTIRITDMTDEEIKQYVDSKINEFRNNAIDIASLPQSEPDAGTTLPFVKQKQLVSALVSNLGGSGNETVGISSVLFSSLDSMVGYEYALGGKGSIFKVVMVNNGPVVGILQILSDNMSHVVTQVFTTHYNDPGTWNSHRDDEIYTYYRSYGIVEGSGTVPTGKWTSWQNIVIPSVLSLLPVGATSTKYGTVKLGTDIVQKIPAQGAQSKSGRTYPVQNDADGKMVVNVPWTDMSADLSGLQDVIDTSVWNIMDGTLSVGMSQSLEQIPGFAAMPVTITVKYKTNDETEKSFKITGFVPGGAATEDVNGTVKLGSGTVQSVAASSPTSESGRTYPVQTDMDGKMVVNVPVDPNIPTVLLSELDALIQPGLSNSQDNYYKVLDYENGHVVGVLTVFSDNMGHVITQVFTTHYDNPGTWSSHRDDEIYVYYRSYKVGGTLDIPQFSWTDWKKLSNSEQIVIPFATSEVYGTVKLGSGTVQSVAANSPTSESGRTYPVQTDADGKMVVNVPWTDTPADLSGLQDVIESLPPGLVDSIDPFSVTEKAVTFNYYAMTRTGNGPYKNDILYSEDIPAATKTTAGVMTATDKSRLDDLFNNGWQYVGRATPGMSVGKPSNKVFYVALEPGTYTSFSNITVNQGEIALLVWDGTSAWVKSVLYNIPSVAYFKNNATVHPRFVRELYLKGLKSGTSYVFNIYKDTTYNIAYLQVFSGTGAVSTNLVAQGAAPLTDKSKSLFALKEMNSSGISGYVVIVNLSGAPVSTGTEIIDNGIVSNAENSPIISLHMDQQAGAQVVEITVGSGKDYTSLKAAIDSIKDSSEKKVYNVYLYPGTYNMVTDFYPSGSYSTAQEGLSLPNYVNLIGRGSYDKIIVTAEFPSSVPQATSEKFSALNLKYNNEVRNITFKAKNCRYACHDESANSYKNWKRVVDNCVFWHEGAEKTDGTLWQWCDGYGQGLSDGAECIFTNCTFRTDVNINGNAGFITHDNTGFTKACSLRFENCTFKNTVYPLCFRAGTLGSGVDNIITLNGCQFIGTGDGNTIEQKVEGSGHSGRTYDFFFKGHSNIGASPYYDDTLQIDLIGSEGSFPTVSIDNLDDMIGDLPDILNGKKSSIYHVSMLGQNVGILEVAGDNMGHQITQRLYGNFVYDGGAQTSDGRYISGNLNKTTHRDGAPSTMFRVFNLSSPYADTNMFPKGQWSTWYNEYYFALEGIFTSDSALTTSEIEEAINSLDE